MGETSDGTFSLLLMTAFGPQSCIFVFFFPLSLFISSIQPCSILHNILNRVTGELELIPADFGQEAGYNLDKSPANHRAHIETPTSKQMYESLIHRPASISLKQDSGIPAWLHLVK